MMHGAQIASSRPIAAACRVRRYYPTCCCGRRLVRRSTAGAASWKRQRRGRRAPGATRGRHGHHQRRRTAARRILDVCAACAWRASAAKPASDAAGYRRLSAVCEDAAGAQGVAIASTTRRARSEKSATRPYRRAGGMRDVPGCTGQARKEAGGNLHDGRVSGNHRDHHGKCLLRFVSDLRARARARAAQGIRGHCVLRVHVATRRAGLRSRTRAHVQEQARGGIHADHGAQRRSDEPGHPKVSRAKRSACTCAGATGKGRTPTTSPSRSCCRCSTAARSARSASSSPIRGISTNMRRSGKTRCRPR